MATGAGHSDSLSLPFSLYLDSLTLTYSSLLLNSSHEYHAIHIHTEFIWTRKWFKKPDIYMYMYHADVFHNRGLKFQLAGSSYSDATVYPV